MRYYNRTVDGEEQRQRSLEKFGAETSRAGRGRMARGQGRGGTCQRYGNYRSFLASSTCQSRHRAIDPSTRHLRSTFARVINPLRTGAIARIVTSRRCGRTWIFFRPNLGSQLCDTHVRNGVQMGYLLRYLANDGPPFRFCSFRGIARTSAVVVANR